MLKLLSVTQINTYIKKLIESDFILRSVKVNGEISNFKLHTSGHLYFSLKDEESSISCVMFKTSVQNLKFKPENGMSVIVYGRISTYLRDGSYQIYCTDMEREGLGDLFIKFEEVKKKLYLEGLFDLTRKREIPKFPKNVGIVTSETGAAIKDIINIARRRNKYTNIIIYPAQVQGLNAQLSIIESLKLAFKNKDLDVIILARGGGSIEDIWCFNDEKLARVLSMSPVPTVTGVGHEVDTTLVDLVADLRAPTPSAAAEIVFFNEDDLVKVLRNIDELILERTLKKIKYFTNNVNNITMELENQNPLNQIVLSYGKIDEYVNRLNNNIETFFKNSWHQIEKYSLLLEAHNPKNILNKGYSIIESTEGRLIDEISGFKSKNSYLITFKDGRLKTYIDDVELL
ncbi:MAG: exodeoxyribonuclease VII large subunit [Oscillospiraceae bacterium]|nr:exodeoxyribonuclease VII large subunit [Oscillospiraceae bacterium]